MACGYSTPLSDCQTVLLILGVYMRQIESRETDIIAFLAHSAGVQISVSIYQLVWVVNKEINSIRGDYCPKGSRVRAVASSGLPTSRWSG